EPLLSVVILTRSVPMQSLCSTGSGSTPRISPHAGSIERAIPSAATRPDAMRSGEQVMVRGPLQKNTPDRLSPACDGPSAGEIWRPAGNADVELASFGASR